MGQLNVLLARKYGTGRKSSALTWLNSGFTGQKELGANEVIDVSKDNLTDALRNLTDGIMADVVVVGPTALMR